MGYFTVCDVLFGLFPRIPLEVGKELKFDFFTGDESLPCGLSREYEHSAETGTDPIQQTHLRNQIHPAEPPESHQGFGGHVS